MTRPEIIRADTIDLQDQYSPSAQDHTRQPTHPKPLGAGPPAPHQAEALRELAAEAAEQNHGNPRVSKEWTNGGMHQLQHYGGGELSAGATASLAGVNLHQDTLAVAQNGGHTGSTTEDAEMADADGEDGIDDDMMDKISSSPSIDDGRYLPPPMWPLRSDSLSIAVRTKSSPSFSQACSESSSPFVETPVHFSLRSVPEQIDKDAIQVSQVEKNYHHPQGEYPDRTCDDNTRYEAEATYEIPPLPTGVIERYIEHCNEHLYLDYVSNRPLAEKWEMDDSCDHDEHEGPLTLPYEESEDDDDYDVPYTDDSRFIDSGWGGDCLQEVEDIDFEFVYALHTFVATVEGQANATKGDTMVLLDDSNSYWWLVRVVKDSSIGYLPAEHIETPTERLARLNKHRNIDVGSTTNFSGTQPNLAQLTSTMLGDQAEKTKNPLKIAIRRRNAKTVTFTSPTYFEASDIDYSTDEEEGEGDIFANNREKEPIGDEKEPGPGSDEIAAAEPLKHQAEVRVDNEEKDETSPVETRSDVGRTSDEIFEGKLESRQTKNGTVRNTDSFFKDDSVETRKITLTPNLLRDDSSTSTRTSNDSKEFKQRASLDKLEKDPPTDKGKDRKDKKDKKEKEKKPGMLSGLFKRKDKKSKSQDEDIDEIIMGKRSNENPSASPVPSKDSEEVMAEEFSQIQAPEVQRQPSKLQKQPRTESSPARKPGQAAKVAESQQLPAPERPAPTESVQQPSMRLVQPDTAPEDQKPLEHSPERTRGPVPLTTLTEQKPASAMSMVIRSASASNSESQPVKAKKAESRLELDDFDSSPEDSPVEESSRGPIQQPQRPIPGSFPDSYIGYMATPSEARNGAEERLSESPVQVSPSTPSHLHPPPLVIDTASQEEPPSPASSPSPELIDADDARENKGGSTTSASTATWSDANLRTFFDDDADIKDLLLVVYDNSGVVPAGPDHPVTGNLFKDENAKLADITNRLDSMLGDWLARKMRAQSSR